MKRLFLLLLMAGVPCFAQFDATTLQGKQPCTAARTVNCVTVADATGNVSIGTAVSSARVSVNRLANGAVAVHSLVKGVTGGLVGPVASDFEGILGVAENVTTTSGDAVVVTELGVTTILCESAVDLNYLIAGTDPTKVKDSGFSSIDKISASTRIIAKSMGACSGGLVTANVLGPYRFGGTGPQSICRLTTDIVNTGSTTTNVLWACTIPAGTISSTGRLAFEAIETNGANSGTCSYWFNLGTSPIIGGSIQAGISGPTSANRSISQRGQCANRGSTSSQLCSASTFSNTNSIGFNAFLGAYASATVPLYLLFSATNSVSGDSCTLNYIDVTIWP